jgi:hypothetical protein
MKKEIIKKIKSANGVYIHNGFLEYYFKASKSELLTLFKERYKRQKESDAGERFLESFLEDFNDQIVINENNNLFFN